MRVAPSTIPTPDTGSSTYSLLSLGLERARVISHRGSQQWRHQPPNPEPGMLLQLEFVCIGVAAPFGS